MNLINNDIEIQSLRNSDFVNLNIKPFKLYKFRFYGVGLKSIKPNIYTENYKSFFLYGKAHLLGTYIDIWFFAFQEMSPLVSIIGIISGICLALGITLLVLKKVEDMSFIVYSVLIGSILIIYRKQVLKVLK